MAASVRWCAFFALSGVFISTIATPAASEPTLAEAAASATSGAPAAPARVRIASAEPYSPAPFRDGEVLRYRARWQFIPLGTLVCTQRRVGPGGDGEERYEVGMTVDTPRRLPFVSVHFDNRSILSRFGPENRCFVFQSRNPDASRVVYRRSGRDQPLQVQESRGGTTIREESVPHAGPLYDADGLFMLIRCLAASGLQVSLPTIVDRRIRPTRLSFTEEVRTLRVPAFAGGVCARRVEARADWATGSCAGLTGRFHGWVTDDERAIPVKLAFEIALGSVVLELETFARPEETAAGARGQAPADRSSLVVAGNGGE